jgi:hypothetical protein
MPQAYLIRSLGMSLTASVQTAWKRRMKTTESYGFCLKDCREHLCRCGAPRCIGRIVAQEF